MTLLWHPAATRDPTPAQPGETFGSGGHKMVLLTAEALTKPSYQINGYTPHFTFDTRPNGRLFQHIPITKSAYALEVNGSENPNKTGYVISVMLYGNARYAHDWSAEQLRRLGWLLSWISDQLGIRETFPRAFVGPNEAKAGAQRLSWSQWQTVNGILGQQHAPFDWPDGVGPGRIDTRLLYTMLGQGAAPPGGTVNIGGGGGQEDIRTDGAGNIVEEETKDETYQVAYVQDVDMTNKSFRFNPPLHSYATPQRVNLADDSRRAVTASLDQWTKEKGLPRELTDSKYGQLLNNYRLGRVIQDKTSAGRAADTKFRHGFRFLYNPNSINVSASRNSSVILDGRSAANIVLSGVNQNFQVITLQLLLNRIPDLMLPRISSADYSPRLYGGDEVGIRTRGTHYDLEFLYRICNGVWDLEDRGTTADIGVIIPMNARLILGRDQNFFGFIERVSYTDEMFNTDMVPMLTKVDLSFRRHVDINPDDSDAWLTRFSTVAKSSQLEAEDDSDSDTGSGDSGYVGNPREAPVPGRKVTYCWGARHSRYSVGYHTGDDYSAPSGTIVTATKGGKVVLSGWNSRESAYGISVVIESVGQNGQKFWHLYAHLLNTAVRVGDTVVAGQQVGRVGSSGTSTGAHLHYEERVGSAGNYPGRKPIYNAGRGACS